MCFSAATGRILWRTILGSRAINLQTHKWRGYNPVIFVANGVVFIQPEGRHGGQAFLMLDGDPRSFRVLGQSKPPAGDIKHRAAMEWQWIPPHPHDTAYANHPVGYPLVDGRLFIRGHDGLYCYDLRKPSGK